MAKINSSAHVAGHLVRRSRAKMKLSATSRQYLRPRRSPQQIKFWRKHRIGTDLITERIPTLMKPKRRINWPRFKNFLRRGIKQDYMHTGTFQEAIGPVLVLAQVFALMPVRGVLSSSAQNLSFSWYSCRTFYTLSVLIVFGVASCCVIAFTVLNFSFDNMETLAFYILIFLISISFFQLARKWPTVMLEWQKVDADMPAMRTEQQRAALAHQIKMITLVATVCSVIEHILSMLSTIYYVNACPVIPNKPIQSFLYLNFSPIFYFIEYSRIMGITGKVINVLSTFTWNFNDIFVMAISVGLAMRFRQLNDYMEQASASCHASSSYWIECRITYRKVCKLCSTVDDAISVITLLCFSNNLYFVCVKILKSLQKKPSVSHTLYFWFSLSYLLGRTLLLSLYSASIHDEAKRPLKIFRAISRENWCPELKRFTEEVTADTVALTGMKFFYLTRSVVISVAGTIATYELILLQFNKTDKVNDCYEH